MTIKVLVVSPFPAVRAGLRALLAESSEIEVVGEAVGATGLGGVTNSPDVVLVDGSAGPEAITAIESQAPEVGIVLLGAEPARRSTAWRPVARGYLAHDASGAEIEAALRAVVSGLAVIEPALIRSLFPAELPAVGSATIPREEPLTPRELEVLQLIAAGLPNKTIAVRLNISEHTAKFHVSSVLSKLGSASRTEAVTTAARAGLLLL